MKKLLTIIPLLLLINTTLLLPQQQEVADATQELERLDQQTSNSQDDDIYIQQLAISTVANMANNILTIAQDPNNPQNVSNSIVNIIANFANLITQAMKNRQLRSFLASEEFKIQIQELLTIQA